ncbi:MAG: pyrroline-5-carboxylate reductase [Treponema sp.]|jgi:pyrroline-5-carboxylate reductase|nr:pyrroline-5-carboxylate reductase [Treponema sp.]
MIKITCIGSGNMGFALMKATAKRADVFFTDVDTEKARHACKQLTSIKLNASVLTSNTEAAEEGDFIFLAVKPQVLSDVLAEITPAVLKRQKTGSAPVLVSMAAGWSIDKIQSAVGQKVPVIRLMPNTPALIGKGMIAMSASPEVPADKLNEYKDILGDIGIVDYLEEHYMDAVTGLSGSGPGFVYLFIEALADGGVRTGLPRDKALSYAAQTVLGAAAMVKETGIHPGELKDMVTSPGGTTIAGIAELENGAFRSTVMKAVEAAWKRSIELG